MRQEQVNRQATKTPSSAETLIGKREGQRSYLASLLGLDGLKWDWLCWLSQWFERQAKNGEAYNQAIFSNTRTYAQKPERERRIRT